MTSDFLRYVFEERNLDEVAKLNSADVDFVDPTVDIWGAPLANAVRGREDVLAIMRNARVSGRTRVIAALRDGARSWGECELVLDKDSSSARRAILIGTLRDRSPNTRKPITFAWLLELQHGRIVERREILDACALVLRSTQEH